MQLSKHFKLEEMTKSMTATRKGIDNSHFSLLYLLTLQYQVKLFLIAFEEIQC